MKIKKSCNKLVTGLTKDKNHDHYWIDDEVIYESYRTIRGLRYRPILEVFGNIFENPELLAVPQADR